MVRPFPATARRPPGIFEDNFLRYIGLAAGSKKLVWAIAAPGTEIDPHRARYFPLWLPTFDAKDHVVRRVNSVSHFTRSSKLSNRTSPCGKRSVRGIRLHRLEEKSRNRLLQLAKWH